MRLVRAAEQHRILPDEAELRAQIDRRMLAAVEPVDEDIARLGRVEPAEQPAERRLARRDAADDRDPLARRDLEVDVVERRRRGARIRSEEHTSELQSLMRISYAVFCLKKKITMHMTVNRNLP